MDTNHPTKILLVEDSSTHSELIAKALSAWDRPFELSIARTLHEARQHMAELRPDLMLVDLMLPDGHGTDLLPARREDVRLPILIMTSHGNEMEAVKAMKAGALDYLVKSSTMLTDMPRAVERALREWEHICRRRQAEANLRKSEARWRSTFEIAAAGMVIVSPEGILLEVNSWFRNLLGYTEAELIGRPVVEIVHPEDRDKTAQWYRETATGQSATAHFAKRYLCRDDRIVWGHASLSCVLDEEQRPLYCVGLVQDISDRVLAEEELRKANRDLDAFVHTVTHDLRSPLTPIIGYAQLLDKVYGDQMDETARSYLEVITRQGNRMEELLKDLLALAQVGQIERPSSPVKPAEIVDAIVVAREAQLADANMEIITGELPAARLPKTLLSQIFDNLIANAIRYAGPGGVIELSGERRGTRVRFVVRDHGPGIPLQERKRVFDLFYRSAAAAKQEGTGVGLATVHKIVQLFDGQAWVEETPGGGATILVEMADPL